MTKVPELNIRPLKADLSKACFDLAAEVPGLMRHWPRTSRMGLGRRLEDQVFCLLEGATRISNPTINSATKHSETAKMSTATDLALVYLRLARQLGMLNVEVYLRLAEQVTVVGRQVGGLRKYFDKQTR